MKIFYKKIKGFTLIETLASIAVLSLVIIGPLSVTISSSAYARNTKDTIVATYLAEEAVELLQNQYDSMYVYCRKNASSTEVGGLCVPNLLETSTSQTAWRLFKDRLSGLSGQPTCYLPKNSNGTGSYPNNAMGNSDGCSFDYLHMQASSTEVLERTVSSSVACKYLIPVATSTASTASHIPVPGTEFVTSTSTSYVCAGLPLHIASGLVEPKQYIRSITVDQLSTFEFTPANEQYNDDLRISSSVQYKGVNGVSHTVKIIRFMHARP